MSCGHQSSFSHMKRTRPAEEEEGPDKKVARQDDETTTVSLVPDMWRAIADLVSDVSDWLALAGTSRAIRELVYSVEALYARVRNDECRDPRARSADGYVSEMLGLPHVLGVPLARVDATNAAFLAALNATNIAAEVRAHFKVAPHVSPDLTLVVAGSAAVSAVLEAWRTLPQLLPRQPAAALSGEWSDIDLFVRPSDLAVTLACLRVTPRRSLLAVTHGDHLIFDVGALNVIPWDGHRHLETMAAHEHAKGGERSPLCCFDLACCQFALVFHPRLGGEWTVDALDWRLDGLMALLTGNSRIRHCGTPSRKPPSLFQTWYDSFPFNGKRPYGDGVNKTKLNSRAMARFLQRLDKYAARHYRFADLASTRLFADRPALTDSDRMAELRRFTPHRVGVHPSDIIEDYASTFSLDHDGTARRLWLIGMNHSTDDE